MIFDRAEHDPEGLALDDLERTRSWAELADRALRFAALYRELGVRPHEHAALLMGNRVEFVECVLGAFLAGIWLTPVNHHLTAEEVRYVVSDSGSGVVLADEAHADVARASGAQRVLVAGAELEDAIGAVAAEGGPDLSGPAGGTMMYTSGTTGQPKGVKRQRAATVKDALAGQERYGRAIGLDGSGAHLVTGPLYHAAPGLFAVYDQACGAPMVVMPRWDERRFLALVQERRIRHTHLVPTMFVRLLRLPEEERAAFDTSSLDVVLHGAAPVSVAVKRRMIEWWGAVLVEYWGGTEGGVTTLVDSEEWLAHPGTVGRALPHYEVFAVDSQGRRLPAGQTGALYSRHRTTSRLFEYHGDEEKTERAYLTPDAFTLGDVGWVDEEGFLFLADRETNMIITGGVNVYPAEVEQVLQEHPAVADVAVFGVPDDEWGETVKAAVELAPGFQAGEDLEVGILAHGREHLAGYKVPRSIDFEPSLPRTPAGKLQVRKLRDPYWQGRSRAI